MEFLFRTRLTFRFFISFHIRGCSKRGIKGKGCSIGLNKEKAKAQRGLSRGYKGRLEKRRLKSGLFSNASIMSMLINFNV